MAVSQPDIRIYDSSMNWIGVVEDYEYFGWERNWYAPDRWNLQINRYKQNADLLRTRGNFILLAIGSTMVLGIIETPALPLTREGKSSEIWDISGVGIEGLLNRRIAAYGTGASTGYDTQNVDVAAAMRHYVDYNCVTAGYCGANRVIPGLTIETPAYSFVNGGKFYLNINGNANDALAKHNATLTGCTLASDRFGFSNRSYLLNGTSEYLSLPTMGTDLDFGTGDFTLWMWIKPTRVSANYETLYTTYHSEAPANADGFIFTSWTGASQVFSVWNPIQGWNTTSLSPTNGVWQFVAARRISGVMNVFKNTLKSTNIAFAGSVTPTAKTAYIGGRFDGTTNHFQGNLGEVGIVNRGMSDAELTALYNNTTVNQMVVANFNARFQPLDEICASLAQSAGLSPKLGWTGSGANFIFRVKTGVNRTSTVTLSTEFGNVEGYNYQETDEGGNYLYVAGTNTGASRTVLGVFNGVEVTGLSRRERFVDGREATTSDQLLKKGIEALGAQGDLTAIKATYVDGGTFVYGVDFDVGDLVTVVYPNVASMQTRVVSAKTEFSRDEGKRVSLELGNVEPDMRKVLRLLKRTNEMEARR